MILKTPAQVSSCMKFLVALRPLSQVTACQTTFQVYKYKIYSEFARGPASLYTNLYAKDWARFQVLKGVQNG